MTSAISEISSGWLPLILVGGIVIMGLGAYVGAVMAIILVVMVIGLWALGAYALFTADGPWAPLGRMLWIACLMALLYELDRRRRQR